MISSHRFIIPAFFCFFSFSYSTVYTQSISESIVPSNNIRQYLMDKATEITDKSLSNIKTLDEWKAVRSSKQHLLAEMLGLESYPVFEKRDPVKVSYVDTIQQYGFSNVKLYYESTDELNVPANLYVPDNLSKPAPAILYVCGHAHNQKSHYQAHARNFVKNGFVTVLIETIQRGEVKGVILKDPPPTQNLPDSPDGHKPAFAMARAGKAGIEMLYCLQITDFPQVVGLHYPKRVTILDDAPESFQWVKDLYSKLGLEDQFQILGQLNEKVW